MFKKIIQIAPELDRSIQQQIIKINHLYPKPIISKENKNKNFHLICFNRKIYECFNIRVFGMFYYKNLKIVIFEA